ncbi:HigA family addiction module antitoxin [Sediminibacterium sp.]|uniref:HigA family addiction module antitoxin n=1 Tax=Sediminibacterium sp. TaxID=1917865 RepID=UPI003F71398C
MKTKHITPAKAIHPGEILLDELEAREISEKEFAIKSGIQPDQLNEIIEGKRGITIEYADLIGKGLDMEPTIWQNLQTLYELDLVKNAKSKVS